MSELYLQHYGVKGMKWGVRKEAYEPVRSARQNLKEQKMAYKAAKKAGKNKRAAKSKYLNAKFALTGEEAKYRTKRGLGKQKEGGLEKYRSQDVGAYEKMWGRGAVKRLARDTRKGKVRSIYQGNTRETRRRFIASAATASVLLAVASPTGRRAIKRGAAKVASLGLKAVAIAAEAHRYTNSKGPSVSVKNLEPIAALPDALRLRK